LRRAIQERVEDALADEILKGRISSGSHILVGLDKDKINFKEKKSVRVLKK